jgi:hypothetical protein
MQYAKLIAERRQTLKDKAQETQLGPEFVQALIAEATSDGVTTLARFYQILNANALYIPIARRTFTTWAAESRFMPSSTKPIGFHLTTERRVDQHDS